MVIRMAPWTLAVALTLLTVAPVGAEDVIPPRLTCVDGLFSRSIPIPGEHLRLRRWLCDVDGQANGECTFGRRCRRHFGCSGIRIRCRVRVVVPVGEQRPEGPLTLACASSSTATPCGPELSCDSASQTSALASGRHTRPRRRRPFAAPAYTHPAQTQEIEFGPSSRHVSNGHRLARTQPQRRSDSQPDGTAAHA